MQYENILKKLKTLSNPRSVEDMARFGINPKSAKWIASDAIRELTSEAVQERLQKRGK